MKIGDLRFEKSLIHFLRLSVVVYMSDLCDLVEIEFDFWLRLGNVLALVLGMRNMWKEMGILFLSYHFIWN